MNHFRKLFNKKCSVIGMIHLDALPGTPNYRGSVQNIVDQALSELDVYLNCNVDGILIENMNDIPYIQPKYLKPEITSTMARVCTEVRRNAPTIPCGIQVLASCNEEALSIALACGLNFIRAEGYVFAHVADEGITNACAGNLLRYRKHIEAQNVAVFTDIKKKHSSHAITQDVNLVETARAAQFFMSDGIILTGASTGDPADLNELNNLKTYIDLPILIGSGVTYNNLENYISADALIVGSYFKKYDYWENDLEQNKIVKFMDKVKQLTN